MARLLGAFYLSLLFILLLLSQFLDAIDLSVKHPAQGQPRVRLDSGLATQPIPGVAESDRREDQHRYLWSSYLVFNEPVSSITDGQLGMIAQVAHQEMEKDMRQYKPGFFVKGTTKPVYLPSVMTIVAFGNEIIFSSSQKGQDGFINEWPQSPVKLALDRCSALWRDRVVNDPGSNADPAAGHENKAKCGEVNSFHQYYMTHTTPISEVDPKVRVTIVVRGNKGFSILAPCGTANNGEDEKDLWGCSLLARDKDVYYIGQGEKALPFALHKIAGGVQRKGQIQMCTRNHIIWDGE
ncbi:hypothetical protein IWW34DRAFT_876531 [Fusarium oxysporum f. sp. albedinis]|nr:hypothetical protein IWW34DRAFT_876531 [Fusarium oxysporum f. sp. albedinis]KAJ0157413.1 Uncharacterized protein HZ326_0339 [Fusarium oxysporum f. sp. albedinis]KAK2483439.1 hypothetical protein H9L39_05231 [Fusarium oxysporum f. sp. albedinis]